MRKQQHVHPLPKRVEKCLNSYAMSARNAPEGLSESDCEGLSHIPSILASFLQRAQIKTVGESSCKHM